MFFSFYYLLFNDGDGGVFDGVDEEPKDDCGAGTKRMNVASIRPCSSGVPIVTICEPTLRSLVDARFRILRMEVAELIRTIASLPLGPFTMMTGS